MFNPETPPEFVVSRWLNTTAPLSLAQMKGRVVVAVAFQMLCPGCIEHALPQAKRLRARFKADEVAIIALHSVFEDHHQMTPAAVEAFVANAQLPFPVAIDEPDGLGVPRTMAAYQMQGTPTMLIFDRAGRLRRHYFGQPDDILVAAEIMALAIESAESPRNEAAMIERRLAAALSGDQHDHDHGHDHEHGDACGCGHDHGHEHGHRHHGHGPGQTPSAHDPNGAEGASHGVRIAAAERMTEPPRNLKR